MRNSKKAIAPALVAVAIVLASLGGALCDITGLSW